MDLENAIKILKEFVETDRRLRTEIENSISKEAIHKKMQEIEIDYKNKKKMAADTTTKIWWEHEYKAKLQVLWELLEEAKNEQSRRIRKENK